MRAQHEFSMTASAAIRTFNPLALLADQREKCEFAALVPMASVRQPIGFDMVVLNICTHKQLMGIKVASAGIVHKI